MTIGLFLLIVVGIPCAFLLAEYIGEWIANYINKRQRMSKR